MLHLLKKTTHLAKRTSGVLGEGTLFREGKRTTFWYRQERLHRRNHQEPAGMYVVASSELHADGEITIKRPLILPWGATRGAKSWVFHLTEKYGESRVQLTRVLLKKRIDAIITVRHDKTYQIVLLNVPMTKDGVDAEKIQVQAAKEKRIRLLRPPKRSTIKPRGFPEPGQESSGTQGPFFENLRDAEIPGLRWVNVEGIKWHLANQLREEVPLPNLIAQTEELFQEAEKNLKEWKKLLAASEEKLAAMPFSESEEYDYAVGSRDYSADEVKRHQKKLSKRLLQLKILAYWNELQKYPSFNVEAYQKTEAQTQKNRLQAQIQKLLGPEATTQDLLAVCGFEGLRGGSEYATEVTTKNEGESLVVDISGPGIVEMQRTVKTNPNGDLVVKNNLILLEKDAPTGLGTRIFYSQVLAAQEFGVRSIYCQAIRNDDRDNYMVGYYVWARLGYNASLLRILPRGEKRKAILQGLQQAGAFDHRSSLRGLTMHDLMMTQVGRDWWKSNGDSWKATFDLKPTPEGGPNTSLQVLETYVRERSSLLEKPLHKWAALRNPRHPSAEELPLGEIDTDLLNQVWDVMRTRAIRKES